MDGLLHKLLVIKKLKYSVALLLSLAGNKLWFPNCTEGTSRRLLRLKSAILGKPIPVPSKYWMG